MASVRFGTRANGTKIDFLDSDNLVGQSVLKLSNLDNIAAQLALTEAYDITYGIYTATEARDPINIVTMHPHEDYVTDGSVISLAKRIMASKLPTVTHTTLVELMEYPLVILEELLEQAERSVEREAVAVDLLTAQLNQTK